MPVVRIRGIIRRKGPQELTQVFGRINVTGRVGSFPAGSLKLTHVETITLTPSSAVGDGSRFGMVGSVRNPETQARNTILLRAIITGTGTRTTSLTTIGSTATATAVSANFHATGH